MTCDQLAEKHPTLFHMADARNWESIRERGLLSTSALLDMCRLEGEARQNIEARHRPATLAVSDGKRELWVRDQHPLNMNALEGALDQISPGEWLQLLNARVFFWPTLDRLHKMLKVYQSAPQAIFEIETRLLTAKYGEHIEVSRINSGFASSRYTPARRGLHTFVPLAEFTPNAKNQIAEVTVPHSVPDVLDFTKRVVLHHQGREVSVLWESNKAPTP